MTRNLRSVFEVLGGLERKVEWVSGRSVYVYVMKSAVCRDGQRDR